MWYKKLCWSISFKLIFFLSLPVFSQNKEYRYALYFSDKGGAQKVYSANQPENYLSLRAIQRRQKFGIPVDSLDFPLHPAYVQSVFNLLPQARKAGASRWLNVLIISTDNAVSADIFPDFVTRVRKIYEGPLIYRGEVPQTGAQDLPASAFPLLKAGFYQADHQNRMIGGDYLQAGGFQGRNVLVAVLDAGYKNVNQNPAFSHLFEEGRIINTWDFVAWENSVYEDNNHGAYVFSAMAGYLPGSYLSLAPAAAYLLLRTENAGTETVSEEYMWVLGAEYADSAGADIINSSLGYTTFDQSEDSYNYSMLDGKTAVSTRGALMAARKGLMVVNSAGNSGHQPWKHIGVPADADSILAVGAVDQNRNRADFSSIGPSADLRVKPDVSAMGKNTVLIGPQGGITTSNGTSFSSPLIAAGLAALRERFPDVPPMQMLEAVRRSAHAWNSPGNGLGYGIPHFGLVAFILEGNEPDSTYFIAFPNPGSAELLKIEFLAPGAGKYRFEIIDLHGRKVTEKEMEAAARGLYRVEFSLPESLSGTYEIRATGPNFQTSTRWVATQ